MQHLYYNKRYFALYFTTKKTHAYKIEGKIRSTLQTNRSTDTGVCIFRSKVIHKPASSPLNLQGKHTRWME